MNLQITSKFRDMIKIEERAKEYASKNADISLSAVYNEALASIYEEGYIVGAGEQKHLTLEAFDEWLCRNSWITRDEGNRKPLKELRNIIQKI